MSEHRNWIPVRGAQGQHSRQAHADMPEGTFEREMSKEGFFGPAAFFHHRRPPTSWSSFEGPLRPRAFNLAALNAAPASPPNRRAVCSMAPKVSASCRRRFSTEMKIIPDIVKLWPSAWINCEVRNWSEPQNGVSV